jgi:hypothetical protein
MKFFLKPLVPAIGVLGTFLVTMTNGQQEQLKKKRFIWAHDFRKFSPLAHWPHILGQNIIVARVCAAEQAVHHKG